MGGRAVIALLACASLWACGSKTPSPAPAVPAQQVAFEVQGMHCSGCVDAITAKVKGMQGVESCEVDLEGSSAVVRFAAPATAASVEEAIERLGYTASPRREPASQG